MLRTFWQVPSSKNLHSLKRSKGDPHTSLDPVLLYLLPTAFGSDSAGSAIIGLSNSQGTGSSRPWSRPNLGPRWEVVGRGFERVNRNL